MTEVLDIQIGSTYEFVSEVVEEYLPPEQRLRRYTGTRAIVLGLSEDNDPDNSPLYKVRFHDGREGHAWEEELNGWDKTLGQFFGPDGTYGSLR
jgi:hypothetical protein